MKRIVRLIVIIVVLLLLVLACVPFLLDANQFRPLLQTNLSTALGRNVKVGDLKLAILSGGVSASDLSIADDPSFSREPFLRAKTLKIGVELPALVFSRKLHVTTITIDQPEIALLQNASGDWNFSSLGAKSAPKTAPAADPAPAGTADLDLSVKLVKIAGGRLSMGKTGGRVKPQALENMNIELRDFSRVAVFPFSFSAAVAGGGEIKLEGKAGPIPPADTAMTPVAASLKVAHLDLAGSGFVEPASGIAGVVSFDGSGDSDGKIMRMKGRLKAENLKLAKNGSPARRTVEFDFATEYDMRKRSGALSRGDIHLGAAPASLTGTFRQQGESKVLNMNLAGPNMPVPELAEMLPALGVVLPSGSSLQGGTAGARLAMQGTTDQLVTSGSVSLNNTKLAGFDLGSKLSAIQRLAGINSGPNTDIQTLSANLRVAPEGMRADDIRLIAPAIGELSGSGTVSAGHSLDFKMRAMLHTSSVIAVIGDTSIPFMIQGTASSPVFRPDVKGMASEKIKSLTEGGVGKRAGGLLDGLLGGTKKSK